MAVETMLTLSHAYQHHAACMHARLGPPLRVSSLFSQQLHTMATLLRPYRIGHSFVVRLIVEARRLNQGGQEGRHVLRRKPCS